jgi:hypothetical protein
VGVAQMDAEAHAWAQAFSGSGSGTDECRGSCVGTGVQWQWEWHRWMQRLMRAGKAFTPRLCCSLMACPASRRRGTRSDSSAARPPSLSS